MVAISICTSARDVLGEMTALQRESLPWIAVRTLTRLGQAVRAAETAEISGAFQSPTSWTVNSVFAKPATKSAPVATVGFKGGGANLSAGRYLQAEIEAGPRTHKRFEKALIAIGAMPAGMSAIPTRRMQLDGNGNMPRSLARRILGDLQATTGPVQSARKGRGRGKAQAYFANPVPVNGLPAGIYFRQSAAQSALVMVYGSTPRYTRRLDWGGVASATVAKNFAAIFREEAAKIQPRTARR